MIEFNDSLKEIDNKLYFLISKELALDYNLYDKIHLLMVNKIAPGVITQDFISQSIYINMEALLDFFQS